MTVKQRIYLDHAATSWPKLDAVSKAMSDFSRDCGAAAGRGSYRSATDAGKVVTSLRRALARRMDAPDPQCISFHSNGTAALNAAIHGFVRQGDHVVVSAAEHNSVLRPLHHLQQTKGVELTIVPVDQAGVVDADEFLAAVRSDTRLVALTHASNVTGAVQPIESVGDALRDRSTAFLCDAAQTFGTIPISVASSGVDMLAAPGHKSTGGPLGTALLYVSPKLNQEMHAWMQGGTGSQSELLAMPATMPEMLEAGNLNVPALAGWSAAIEAWDDIAGRERLKLSATLAQLLHQRLGEIEHLRVHGTAGRLPIASVTIDDLSPGDAAAILDAEFGIETRAGLHCAALIHGYLGSDREGTLRISAGHTSTVLEIDSVADALRQIVSTIHPS